MKLIHPALELAAQGFEVFPVNEHTKAPYTPNGMKDASTDLSVVERWWQQHPDALIGSRIPEPFVVLDIDPRHHGDEVWGALERSYAPITSGQRHHSGRGDGGHHDWFLHPGGKLSTRRLTDWARANGVGCSAGKRSWTAGIDILHHGHRYTILPPSPHPDTGAPYEWDVRGRPGPMPPFLAALLQPPLLAPTSPREPQINGDSIADWFSDSHSWHDILPAPGWIPIDGDGDSDGSTWRHPNASAATSASVRHGCLFVYSDNTDFDVTEDGDAHGVTRFRAWATLEHDGDLSVAARAAREMKEVRQVAPPSPRTKWEPPTPLVDWPEAYGLGEDQAQWLAEPLIPHASAVAIFAKGGTGKSLLALWIAAGLATGHGLTGPIEPIDVLYLDYEMTIRDVVDRLENMGYAEPDALSRLYYASLPTLAPLDSQAGGRAVLELAQHFKVKLVVIDTFGRAVTGDENEADTVRNWYQWTGRLLKTASIGFLRIDHAGKDATRGQRGTSAKNDDVDIVWEMTNRGHGEYLMQTTKRRVSWVQERVVLQRTEDNGILAYHVREDEDHKVSDAQAESVARLLDELGAPVDISRRKAVGLLRTNGAGRSTDVVNAAVKLRRKAKSGPEDHSQTTNQPTPGPVLGTTAKVQVGPPEDHSGPVFDPTGPESTHHLVVCSDQGARRASWNDPI